MKRSKVILSILITVIVSVGCKGNLKNEAVLNGTQSTVTDNPIPTTDIGGMIEDPVVMNRNNTFDNLNVATYLTKIDNKYFLADCYHNQIIYSHSIEVPLNEWKVLTDEVHYAHTIASDGYGIMTDDTENNRVLIFQQTGEGYAHTQTIENIGLKPHYVQYNEKIEAFMVWSSITGEMYFIKRADNSGQISQYYIDKVVKLEELFGVYVRSFSVIWDKFYFVSGHNNKKIIEAELDYEAGVFEVEAYYEVPAQLAGMVQLTKIEDYHYITVSTDNEENQDYATIIRVKSLSDLKENKYEDIYEEFGLGKGTPYYITEIEGKYYMTHHRTAENVVAFDVVENEISAVEVIY